MSPGEQEGFLALVSRPCMTGSWKEVAGPPLGNTLYCLQAFLNTTRPLPPHVLFEADVLWVAACSLDSPCQRLVAEVWLEKGHLSFSVPWPLGI